MKLYEQYKKLTEKKNLLKTFIETTWMEDTEIEIVDFVEKLFKPIVNSYPSTKILKALTKIDKQVMTGRTLMRVSDKFIFMFNDLLQGK